MKKLQENLAGAVSVVALALLLAGSSASGQLFDAADASKNSAIASSPRAIEQFPGLARKTTTMPAAKAVSTPALAGMARNSSLASSPRVLEQYPALNRTVVPATRTSPDISNAAYAASPRVLEENPSLARGAGAHDADVTFEIAPLK